MSRKNLARGGRVPRGSLLMIGDQGGIDYIVPRPTLVLSGADTRRLLAKPTEEKP